MTSLSSIVGREGAPATGPASFTGRAGVDSILSLVGLWRLACLAFAAAATVGAADDGRPDPTTLLTGALLQEGAAWDAPGAFRIENAEHPLAVDLQRPQTIRALLLQADGNDVYFVDISQDGVSWRTVWRAPRYGGLPGLRTRVTTLSEPVRARFIRVRPTVGDGAFSVSRLRPYETLPSPWPPRLDETRSRLPLFPTLTPDVLGPLRHAIAGFALALLSWRLAAPLMVGRARRWFRFLLGAAAVLSALSFWNFLNFHYYGGTVHLWDSYHYYVGAKYFPEIGYTGLYECSALAQADDGDAESVRRRPMRDLETNQIVPAATALTHPERCRSAFGPERWEAFRADVRYFRQALGESGWARAQEDHGFNATPVWLVGGRALTSLTRATDRSVPLLAFVDVLLLVTACAFVAWAFGFEAACVATIYFGLNALARFAWTGGALLRYDWLLCALASVCLLRRGRDVAAGFAMGYSIALRIFPVFLVAGLAVAPLLEMVRQRRLAPALRHRRVALGLLLSAAVLLPLSVTVTGRPRAWTEFRENTRRFLTTEADNFVGLPVLLAYRPSAREEMTLDPLDPEPLSEWTRAQAAAQRYVTPIVAAMVLLYLALMARATTRLPVWAHPVLGMGLVAIALRAANYYYSWLVLYALLWEVSPGAGLALAGLAWASNLAADVWSQYFDQRAVAFSALVTALVLGVAIHLAARPSPVPDPSDGP